MHNQQGVELGLSCESLRQLRGNWAKKDIIFRRNLPATPKTLEVKWIAFEIINTFVATIKLLIIANFNCSLKANSNRSQGMRQREKKLKSSRLIKKNRNEKK